MWVKPYDADEVFRTLNAVAPFDWRKFFTDRLQSKAASIPLGGVEGGGYAFVYTDAANIFTDPVGARRRPQRVWIARHARDGRRHGGRRVARPAGLCGRHLERHEDRRGQRTPVLEDVFTRALQASKTSTTPLEFIIDNASYFKTVRIDYHGGLKFPHLQRTGAGDDVLRAIAAPKVK